MVLFIFESSLTNLEAFTTIVGLSLPDFSYINLEASSVLWFSGKIKIFFTVQFCHIVFKFLLVMISFKSVGYLHVRYFSHNDDFLKQVFNQVLLCVSVGVLFVTGYDDV